MEETRRDVKPTPIPRQRQTPADAASSRGGGSGGSSSTSGAETRDGDGAKLSKAATTTTRVLKLKEHVGFDSLPDQLVNKATAEGFAFNLLCVGETGIGKSSLVDALFNARFNDEPSSHDEPEVGVACKTFNLRESNVNLSLTVSSSVGFGDQLNKESSVDPILRFIDGKFEDYLQEELMIKRSSRVPDGRVHACLYMLTPTGHSLRSVDLVAMRRLQHKVNLIPVVGKSDVLTKPELERFKRNVLKEIERSDIKIYQFPTDDPEVSSANIRANADVPFAVVGCDEVTVVNQRRVRARQYPWGVVELENEAHSDFVKLREALLRTNLEDLRESTHENHYERYRRERLQEMGFVDGANSSVSEMLEKRRSLHLEQLQRREDDMRAMFVQRVKAKESELKEAEKELHAKFDQLKRSHAEEKKMLEEKRRMFEDEYQAFQQRRDVERASALLRSQQGGMASTLEPHAASHPVHASSSSLSVGKSFSSTLKRFTSAKSVDKSSPELR